MTNELFARLVHLFLTCRSFFNYTTRDEEFRTDARTLVKNNHVPIRDRIIKFLIRQKNFLHKCNLRGLNLNQHPILYNDNYLSRE